MLNSCGESKKPATVNVENYIFKIVVLSLLFPTVVLAQIDSTQSSKLNFTGDFRFRMEHDWSSRKTDGSYREDRSRLRYRLRFGFTYQHNSWIDFGARIRTGDPRKQQDPQLTLGDGFKEFNTLPIGFEKIYVNFNFSDFNIWLGKNTFPFKKQNELFWSDNVFPEGVFISKTFHPGSKLLQSIKIGAGHFIVATNGTTFNNDGYVQGLQVHTTLLSDRLEFYPGIFHFNKMPNIPDGNETFYLDYTIIHTGLNLKLLLDPKITVGLDYYHNLQDLAGNDSIPSKFSDEREGLVMGLTLGDLEKKGSWIFRTTYTFLERYSAVDFLAQNDWARWDYSQFGSPDGRLTNYKGLELMIGYAFSPKFSINSRYFIVEQLVPFGPFRENGNRIRLDIDIGF